MKFRQDARSLVKFWALFFCLIFLSACTVASPQRSAITEFGDASYAFAQLATSELHQMRDGVIQMNVNRLALEGEEGNPDWSDLDEQFNPDVVQVRVESAKVLQDYGDVLVSLSLDTQEAEIQSAADKFVSSVQKLPVSSVGVTEQQLGVIGELVKGIGKRAIEIKRHQAIQQLVNQTHEVLGTLCDLFRQDFDPNVGRLASQYLNTTERLLPVAKIGFFDGSTVSHRAVALEAYQLAMAARDRRMTVIEPISQAAADLKEQHEELVQLVNEREFPFDRLKNLGKRLKRYQWTVEALKEAASR